MSLRHYDVVRDIGLSLDREDLDDYTILFEASDDLSDKAIINGLIRELSLRFSPDLFVTEQLGERVFLLAHRPTDAVLTFADELLDHIEQHGILDEDDYTKVVTEAACCFWAAREINERIQFCIDCGENAGLALKDIVPDELYGHIEEVLVQ